MIAKLGFILIVAIFGALMFAAGALAPDSIRQPMTEHARKAARLVLPASAVAAANSAGTGNKAAPGNTPGAVSAPDAAKGTPLPADSLLLPTPLPDKGQYALQAGRFASAADAAALGARIKDLKLPFDKVLEVVDQNGQHWSIVPVGPYASVDEARMARVAVAREIGTDDSLPVILMPPAKPKS